MAIPVKFFSRVYLDAFGCIGSMLLDSILIGLMLVGLTFCAETCECSDNSSKLGVIQLNVILRDINLDSYMVVILMVTLLVGLKIKALC